MLSLLWLLAADKTIRIWDAIDGKIEAILKGHSQVRTRMGSGEQRVVCAFEARVRGSV
jgi:hypothetical protein